MAIEVRWTWANGLYDVEGDGDGVEVRVRTANLGYASELTRLLLQSTPAAFVPPAERVAPELTPAAEAVLERIFAADADAELGLKAGEAHG